MCDACSSTVQDEDGLRQCGCDDHSDHDNGFCSFCVGCFGCENCDAHSTWCESSARDGVMAWTCGCLQLCEDCGETLLFPCESGIEIDDCAHDMCAECRMQATVCAADGCEACICDSCTVRLRSFPNFVEGGYYCQEHWPEDSPLDEEAEAAVADPVEAEPAAAAV